MDWNAASRPRQRTLYWSPKRFPGFCKPSSISLTLDQLLDHTQTW
eukprot:COSAG01_NODE_1719_length_9392_cov_43.559884_3_plen_45_part_00